MAAEEVEVGTPDLMGAVQWMDRHPLFKDPESPMRRHLVKFLSNRHLPLDHQIELHLTALCEGGYGSLSSSSLSDPIASSLPRLQFYQSLRNSVGSFIRSGDPLFADLKDNLYRWNPDLQAVAAAANRFAGIAQSICIPQMVSLGRRLEALSLAGDDPIHTYRVGYELALLYIVVQMRLRCLMSLLNEALNTPPGAKPLHPDDSSRN